MPAVGGSGGYHKKYKRGGGGGGSSTSVSPGVSDYSGYGGKSRSHGKPSGTPSTVTPSTPTSTTYHGSSGGSSGGGGGRTPQQIAVAHAQRHAVHVAQREANKAAKQIQRENQKTAKAIEKQSQQAQHQLEKQIKQGKPVSPKDIKGPQAKILVSRPGLAHKAAKQTAKLASSKAIKAPATQRLQKSAKVLRTFARQGDQIQNKVAAPSPKFEKAKPPKAQAKKKPATKKKKIMRLPTLDKAQSKVASVVLGTGVKKGATRKELLSSLETGIQESGLRNLGYGTSDSVGWRQERTSIYGKRAANVKKSAKDYFNETKQAGRGKGQTPGELAQSVQRSAYPGAYDPHAPQAKQILAAYAKKTGTKKGGNKYVYPFGKGIAIGRTDMGIDPYPSGSGSKVIRTIGKAKYLGEGGSGWPTEGGQGTGPVYKILKGKLKKKKVYTYEGVTTAKGLKPGEILKKGTPIAKATGADFETGLAFGRKKGFQPVASTYYTEGMATKEGKQFRAIVDSLKGKGSVNIPNIKLSGSSIPSTASSGDVASAAASGAISGVTVTKSGKVMFSSSVPKAVQQRIRAAVSANKKLIKSIQAQQKQRESALNKRKREADAAVQSVRSDLQKMLSDHTSVASSHTASTPKKINVGL